MSRAARKVVAPTGAFVAQVAFAFTLSQVAGSPEPAGVDLLYSFAFVGIVVVVIAALSAAAMAVAEWVDRG